MQIKIKENDLEVGTWVASYIANKINSFAPTAQKPFILGLATGSTPITTYAALVELHRLGKVSFEHVITFNMDEYAGLPKEHPESYHSFMWKYLFTPIKMNPSQVHILDGNAPDLAKECAEYEAKIQALGGMELIIGGIGVDGHLAFNEPGSSLSSRTRVQPLLEETRRINSRFFDNDINKVPTHALTMGVATVCDSREVVLLITGHHKAEALQKIIEESISHWWTASILQMHEQSLIVCDEAACDRLKVSTYKYLKELS